jgi:hypothetical protein
VACSDAGAVVAVKVFVKQYMVSKVRVGLEFLIVAEYGAIAIIVLQKDA